jgi:hypothetical protein
VNRTVLLIALAAAGLVSAVVAFVVLSDAPAVEERAAEPGTAPAAPAGPASPQPEPAETPRETATRPRVPAPAPAAPVAEAPAPVAEAAPPLARLRIDSDVPGAQVFIDRQFVGAAPVVAEGVTPGSHQLNVSAQGYDSVATSIDVAPGDRDILIKLREVRLDVAADVVHRHGIGSCRGRLVATPRGIRYETSNRDDAFTTPLLDLETFQVDYLEKNLRLKLPKGRQFNFTDPEGNADRLFVFHRDVEKARERLRRGDPPGAE